MSTEARADVGRVFGSNLRRLRKRAGLSQEEVAWRASLHRTELGVLEGGGRLPRIDTLLRLAGSLSVDPNALLAGLAWRPTISALGGFEISPPGEEMKRETPDEG